MKIAVPILIVLLAVAAVIIYFAVFTSEILVDSQVPVEANIQINGVDAGTTPLKKRVRAGLYQIKIYKEGFEPWQWEGEVTGTAPLVLSAKLRFLLRSDPVGANVTIDGRDVGVTDMPISLLPGKYTIVYKKKGYRDAKFIVSIPPNAIDSIPLATLVPARAPLMLEEEKPPAEKPSPPDYGAIQVTSTPDAQVFLDGEPQGETPLTLKKIPVGSYVLKLSREGYRDLRQTVYVKKDETAKVAAELKPESVP